MVLYDMVWYCTLTALTTQTEYEAPGYVLPNNMHAHIDTSESDDSSDDTMHLSYDQV